MVVVCEGKKGDKLEQAEEVGKDSEVEQQRQGSRKPPMTCGKWEGLGHQEEKDVPKGRWNHFL